MVGSSWCFQVKQMLTLKRQKYQMIDPFLSRLKQKAPDGKERFTSTK